MSTLRIRVLGPIGAEIDEEPLRLPKRRHREILAILVIAHGAPVSTSRLIDELWDDPPRDAVGSIRTFIAELRRILEPGRPPRTSPEILVTDGVGYALRLGRTAVDLWRAERAIRTADDARPDARASLLAAALQEWRGTVFDEFAARPWAAVERARIAELRAGAVEQLADAHLELDHPTAAIPLLYAHVAEHPWREEGWRLLALALYRSARQRDALTVLAQARTTLIESLGLDPGERLADLERAILRHDPALDARDNGRSILLRAAAAHARTGTRAQLESVTALLPLVAVSGAVDDAAEQHLAAIAAAEQFGDAELTARVIGGFDVPGSWTRSDDPVRSASIVDAALRTLAALPRDASDRVRARLLATIAMESRGTASRLGEAVEAERIARRVGDSPLLCFALSARYLQSFPTTGLARTRERLGAEIVALARSAELPTFEIEGRLIRMQALCALDDLPAAASEADLIDALVTKFDRPLASVFTAWFRWTFTHGAPPPDGSEMPGFRLGLRELAEFTVALRTGAELPDRSFGPYEPWVRPLILARRGRRTQADTALTALPDPPHDLLLEVSWSLVGRAALETGNLPAMRNAYDALLPASGERAAGSGAIDLGPVAPLLDELGRARLDRTDRPLRHSPMQPRG